MRLKLKVKKREGAMNFGDAVHMMTLGGRMRRSHWAVLGQYATYRKARTVPADRSTCAFMGIAEGMPVKIREYFIKKCSDGSMSMNWVPTWDDILAEDWEKAE